MHREFETRLTLERRRAQPTLQIFISLSVYCRPKGFLSHDTRIAINVWCCSSLSSRLILDDTSPRSPIASSQLSGCRCGHVDVYRIPRITIPHPTSRPIPLPTSKWCVLCVCVHSGNWIHTQLDSSGAGRLSCHATASLPWAGRAHVGRVGSTEWSGALLSSTRIITIVSPILSLNRGGPLSLACNTNNFCI